jgi:hypothetical protein
MIALSAIVAGYESILRLLDPQPLENLGILVAAGVIGFAGNELVAVYRIGVGRRIGSAALVADGLHARTDGFTSLAVVVGALGVLAGFPLADPIIGLLITVAILVVLKGATLDIYRRLMDAVDPPLVDGPESTLRGVVGVLDVDGVRLRWIGHRLHAETNLVVDRVPVGHRRPRHRQRREAPTPAPDSQARYRHRARQPRRPRRRCPPRPTRTPQLNSPSGIGALGRSTRQNGSRGGLAAAGDRGRRAHRRGADVEPARAGARGSLHALIQHGAKCTSL